jgi:hypothetical protein
MRSIVMALVIAALLGVLLLLNYYPFRRIAVLFGLARPLPLAGLFIIMALSFPAAMLLARRVDGPAISALYIVSAIWLGLVFFGCAVFAALHLMQGLLQLLGHPLSPRLVGWLSLGLTLAGGLYGVINAVAVRTTRVTIKLAGLERPARIVQISDVHLGAVYGPGFLSKLVERTNAMRPDLVAVTGDLFDGSGKLDYAMVRPLEGLAAPAFFVTGNHENYEGADECAALVSRAGVRVLRNEMAECRGLQIIGMDTPQSGRDQGKENHFRHLSGMPAVDPSRPAILLYHIPLGLERAAARGVDLMLCGHTHNGQMFPFTLFMPLAYRHYSGQGRLNGLDIVVSQGAGTWGPPMRIGSKSEIVVVDLIPQ